MEQEATTFQISSLPRKYNHDAAMTIADAFQEDPLFTKGSRNPRARLVLTYAIAASQIGSGSGFSDVLFSSPTADDDGGGDSSSNAILCACVWEKTKDDFKYGTFELILKNMLMGFSMYYYLIKGAAYTVGYHKQVGVVINVILVILYSVCTLWIFRFLFELFRVAFVYSYMVAEGSRFLKKYEADTGQQLGKRAKHLSMVGTLTASRGQGVGSALMRYTLKKHDESNLYDYYYLESSNPKNVPFYERHGFVVTGDAKVMGEKATFMIRKKPSTMIMD